MILALKTIPSGRPSPVCYPQPVIRYIHSFALYLDATFLNHNLQMYRAEMTTDKPELVSTLNST